MRKILQDPHFRLALISSLYTVFLLLILPRVPVVINRGPININSYIGGYKFSLFNKDFDFSKFKKSYELGGGYKLGFTVPLVDLDSFMSAMTKRLKSLNIRDYKLDNHYEGEEAQLVLYLPDIPDIDEMEYYLSQRSFLTFKELKEDIVWDEENSAEYVYNPEYWVDTGLDSKEIIRLYPLNNEAVGSSSPMQLQVYLTTEGKSLFAGIVDKNVGKPVALYFDDIPISMPLVGEDLVGVLDINPVMTLNMPQKTTMRLINQVNSGYYPQDYVYIGREQVGAIYKGFSTRLLALSAICGFTAGSLFIFLTYRKFSFAFLMSLLVQFISMLFFLKVLSIYISFRTILVISLFIYFYVSFGMLLLHRMKEHFQDSSLIGIFMKESFKNSVILVKPYYVLIFASIVMFLVVYGEYNLLLVKELFVGLISTLVAYQTFKIFAQIFWVKKAK